MLSPAAHRNETRWRHSGRVGGALSFDLPDERERRTTGQFASLAIFLGEYLVPRDFSRKLRAARAIAGRCAPLCVAECCPCSILHTFASQRRASSGASPSGLSSRCVLIGGGGRTSGWVLSQAKPHAVAGRTAQIVMGLLEC